MNEQALTKLAELVGYRRGPLVLVDRPNVDGWYDPGDNFSVTLDFDPENDANDDYAVLRYFDEMPHCAKLKQFLDILWDVRISEYTPGFWSRAACVALGIENAPDDNS